MVGEKGTCLFIGKISLCEMSSRDGLDDEGCSHKKTGLCGENSKTGGGGRGAPSLPLHCFLSTVQFKGPQSDGHLQEIRNQT